MSQAENTPLEAVLRHDRAVVIAGLVVVVAASWIWILLGAGMGMDALEMTRLSTRQTAGGGMPDAAMPGMAMAMVRPAVWDAGYAVLMFSMWWVMMVAMMLPSATPMLLIHARINRKEHAAGRPFVSTGIFAAGYLAAWAGFSLVAVALQWGFERLGLLSSMLVASNVWLAAAILLAAGLWQLTPIKQACLRHCRSPIFYLAHAWRPGPGGAFRMGLHHGSYCLGCCWFLMGLLFFGGVMNLYWIAGLAVFVLLEKLVPMGHWLGRIIGIGLAGWGVWVAAAAI